MIVKSGAGLRTTLFLLNNSNLLGVLRSLLPLGNFGTFTLTWQRIVGARAHTIVALPLMNLFSVFLSN